MERGTGTGDTISKSVGSMLFLLAGYFDPSPLLSLAPKHMEGNGNGNGNEMYSEAWQAFCKSFGQVQNVLDQNRLLITQINQNHQSNISENLSTNVGLIRELNDNIGRVVNLYAELSGTFSRAMETSSEGNSVGLPKSDGEPAVTSGHKRLRPA